jgi:hypothetical protein
VEVVDERPAYGRTQQDVGASADPLVGTGADEFHSHVLPRGGGRVADLGHRRTASASALTADCTSEAKVFPFSPAVRYPLPFSAASTWYFYIAGEA